jgi:hypothetical protein
MALFRDSEFAKRYVLQIDAEATNRLQHGQLGLAELVHEHVQLRKILGADNLCARSSSARGSPSSERQ